MKLITTYKEHKEKPNEPVQGLGRSLAYSGLNYIFSLLKNDETYQEELEDSIVGIEAYINEREQEIERLTKENNILKKNAEHNDKVVDNVNWENMLLKRRINKAIEYIEKERRTYENDEYCFDNMLEDVTPLLDILKGVDKE